MGRADRGLSVAGPRSSSRPTAQNPSLPINSYMSAARWRAGIARRYDTKGTPTDINTHTRATVRTSHRRPGRTTARACVVARPSVRPSARPPARPPARPSVRARVGGATSPRPCGIRRHHHRRRSRRRRHSYRRRYRLGRWYDGVPSERLSCGGMVWCLEREMVS